MPPDLLTAEAVSAASSWIVAMVVVMVLIGFVLLARGGHDTFMLGVALLMTAPGVVFVVMPLSRSMVNVPLPPPPAAPTVELDTFPTDWGRVVETALWVLSWVGSIVAIAVALWLFYRAPRWAWAAVVWWCSPPPVWLCHWLGRPTYRMRPGQRRALSETTAIPADVWVIVRDDPVFADVDRALAWSAPLKLIKGGQS